MTLKVGDPVTTDQPLDNSLKELESIFITESFKSTSEALNQC